MIRISNSETGDYFHLVCDAYQRAEDTTGTCIERFYKIDCLTIRLRFAGPALVPLITPALAHLAAEPVTSPSLTVSLADSSSTQTELPHPPWNGRESLDTANATSRVDQTTIRFKDDDIVGVFQHGDDTLSMLNYDLAQAVFWLPDATHISSHERGGPLRNIFHWWSSQQGYQQIHAAAVGTSRGAVLLAGKSGSGKSTTALSCLSAGFDYLGDDYCLLKNDPAPYAHSLYSSAKADHNTLQRFPELGSSIDNPDRPDTEKAVLFLHRDHSTKVTTSSPVRAILVPKITGRPQTRLKPAPRIEAVKALAPSTIFQFVDAGSTDLRRITQCAHALPCYVLEVGTELKQIPAVIREFLAT